MVWSPTFPNMSWYLDTVLNISSYNNLQFSVTSWMQYLGVCWRILIFTLSHISPKYRRKFYWRTLKICLRSQHCNTVLKMNQLNIWCDVCPSSVSIQSPHEPITMSHLYTRNRGGRHHTAITTIYSIKIIIITTGRYHQPVLGEGENIIWFNHFSVKILFITIIWYICSVWSCMMFLTWILTTNENQNMEFNNLIKLSLVAC